MLRGQRWSGEPCASSTVSVRPTPHSRKGVLLRPCTCSRLRGCTKATFACVNLPRTMRTSASCAEGQCCARKARTSAASCSSEKCPWRKPSQRASVASALITQGRFGGNASMAPRRVAAESTTGPMAATRAISEPSAALIMAAGRSSSPTAGSPTILSSPISPVRWATSSARAPARWACAASSRNLPPPRCKSTTLPSTCSLSKGSTPCLFSGSNTTLPLKAVRSPLHHAAGNASTDMRGAENARSMSRSSRAAPMWYLGWLSACASSSSPGSSRAPLCEPWAPKRTM
mmetsp:Transcript_100422/g.266958  ORF Transcript_100422/g.266958 Transcript_100422/m.266958 type:complete len:288 (+) Transcript_100422:1114-1977(+)